MKKRCQARVSTRQHVAKSGSHEQKRLLRKLESQLQDAEQAQTRLYEAIEKGLIELDYR